MNKVLGIIRDARFGNRDIGRPCLYFTAETLDGSSLQILIDTALEVIKESGVYEVSDLNGKGCVLESYEGIHRFVKLVHNA